MDEPSELSLREIHAYFLRNNYKVTNTQLVKYFKRFLTGPSINEARKQFKTYVNVLATIKSEGNEKYLILRKKYYNEAPSEESLMDPNACMSPVSMISMSSDSGDSPSRQPPPYRPPPQFSSAPSSPAINHHPVPPSMTTVGLPILEAQTKVQYKDCVNEFQQAMSNFMDSNRVDVTSRKNSFEQIIEDQTPPSLPPRKRTSIDHRSISRENSIEQASEKDENKENIQSPDPVAASTPETDENKISVREAMMKFNRYASEEEAKVPSPLSKATKKQDKYFLDDTTGSSESLTNHPRAKEWMLAAARGNYQELAKLASEHPQLVKLQDPNTTALHWGSKHGNENVVKLIAGSLKADVNIRTNGGYTALHIAMQFGRNDIFELLCNVYKANRDVLDWSGKKPLDYQKQLTSISSATFSKIKLRKKHSEKDNSFLRIGSLRIGNLLGVNTKLPIHHHQQIRSSAPLSSFDIKLHKNWGSADNVLPSSNQDTMGPPKFAAKKRRQKRDIPDYPSPLTECQSMPTTPNLEGRHKAGDISPDHDSDTAYGFDNNWGA